MDKLLVQSRGSTSDPAYENVMVKLGEEEFAFTDFCQAHGVKPLYMDVINSCHGDTDMTLDLAEDVQRLADAGHKVVSVQAGGLYFAKPSLEAANMPTIPVISVPLAGAYEGLDSFLAAQVPTGTAVIGGVGVKNYQAAANVAVRMLNRSFDGVYIWAGTSKLEGKLEELGIPILGLAPDCGPDDLLIGNVTHDTLSDFENYGALGVFSPVWGADSTPEDAIALMRACSNLGKSVYVRGEENLAFYAAKIMAAERPDLQEKLKQASQDKRDSYTQRKIARESFPE